MNQQEVIKYVDSQERYTELLKKELDQERLQRIGHENNNRMAAYGGQKEMNIAEMQLNPDKVLLKIYHDLSSHELVIDVNGNEVWATPKDDRLKILSDYGVKQIMNLLSFYINENTLLSYYDELTVKWKVRDFGIELADLIFNRYESFFYYPTPEELYDKYLPIAVANKMEITYRELYEKCFKWSQDELQSKFRHYPIIVMSVMNAVDSTYRRAIKGEERESYRKFMHISQNASYSPSPQIQPQKFSMVKPSTWGGG